MDVIWYWNGSYLDVLKAIVFGTWYFMYMYICKKKNAQSLT